MKKLLADLNHLVEMYEISLSPDQDYLYIHSPNFVAVKVIKITEVENIETVTTIRGNDFSIILWNNVKIIHTSIR